MALDCEAVVLAAGLSSRVGGFKPSLDCGGVPLLVRVVRAFRGTCRRIYVVTGYRGAEVAALVAGEPEVEIVVNPIWEKGMFTSVSAGTARVASERFFVTPGDLPLVTPRAISLLASRPESHEPRAVVVPVWRGKAGHPVLLARSWALEILKADPAATLRSVLARAARTEVSMEDDGVLRDVDTCEDYEELAGRFGRND